MITDDKIKELRTLSKMDAWDFGEIGKVQDALPALLDEIERLRKENEWLKNEINLIIAPVEVGGGAKHYVLSVLADIKAAIGCAEKPMLSKLADTIRCRFSEVRNGALEEAAKAVAGICNSPKLVSKLTEAIRALKKEA